MLTYSYKVRDKSGKVLQGQMEAADGKDLRKKLDEHQFFIIEYAEKKTPQNFLSVDILAPFKRVKLSHISLFSWQLYTMLNAGITLTNTLKIIENQTKNENFKSVLNSIWQRVEGGAPFSDALREHPYIFSRLYVQLVNAGEIGGTLDEMLKRLAIYYERQDETSAKLKSALTYPVLLVLASVGVIIFMVTYILPQFTGIFEDLGVGIPISTRLLLGASEIIRNYWVLLTLIPFVLYILFRSFTATGKGRYQIDKLILRFPITGELVRKTTAARFTQILSTLVGAGIPILTSLEVVTETMGNTVVTKVLRGVHARVEEGKTIAQPLGESEIFPEMVVNMISVGEETGSLESMLEKISQFYDKEVDNAIQTFIKLIEPLLIVFMTMVIGFIALSIFLPMTDILEGMHGY